MEPRLTPEQRAAVEHAGGPAVVLAGAGAGKTRVLCHRLAWLVASGARPAEVLALTFTREAAHELRARAEALIGRSHETLRVSTFHSYAIELARVHGVERGLLPDVALVSPEERMIMLLERIGELDLRLLDLRGDTAALVADLVRRIDRCRDQLVSAASYRRWAEAALAAAGNASAQHRARRELEFARVYEAHDRWLAEDGLEDFGASIVRALELLRRHPDRLAAAREGVRHALVDEFQDTNHAQAELLHLVAGGAESLMVVGDDDQGIYRFRGASTKNVADFRRVHREAVVLRLERNYRSTQSILDAAAAVVAPVPGRTPKRLVADAAAPGGPRFWRAADPDGAARAVVDEVVRLAAAGVPHEEQAVLVRAVRLEARPLMEALERAGVPHQVRGGVGLLERREVRAATAWLRAATDPADAQAHLRIAADPELGLPWTAAAEAVAVAATARRPVQGALVEVARAAGAPRLERVLEELGRAVAELPPAEALRVVLDRSGVRQAALAAGGAEGAARLAGLAGLERLAREILERRPGLDARGLAGMLAGLAEVGFRGEAGAPAERQGVQLMTVHQAKGLEFDAVFVMGLTAMNFPGRDRGRGDIPDQLLPEALPTGAEAHLAEARRLLYVAMTRARRHLVLVTLERGASGAAQRPSPFLEEAMAAVPGAELEPVGAAPERTLLREIGASRERLDRAVRRAARARAEGEPVAESLLDEAGAALRELVAAETAALRPPPAPELPAPVRPGRAEPLALTPSAIERYRTCPLQYRFAHVDRVPGRGAPSHAVGVAAHAALEAHYRPDGDGGDGEVLVGRFARALRRAGAADTPEGRQALLRAREALPRYHGRVARSRARPVAVERAFTLAVGPHRVHGRIDRIDRHPAGGFQLIDYKTGRPPQGEGERAGGDLVMRLYLAGAREAFRIEARGATLEHVLDGDARPVHPDGVEIAEAVEEVARVAAAIGARRFEPRPSWACRLCDYAGLCPALDR